MIVPQKAGTELLDEIRATRPTGAGGGLAVWWLGQSGFLLESAHGMLVVDPYLSEHLTTKYHGTVRPHVRMTEAPCQPGDLREVDLILASHKHSDHLDPGTVPSLMEASPQARLVVPRSLLDHAAGLGLPMERVLGLDAGEMLDHAGFRVRAVPSAHEGLDKDAAGLHLYLGFVVEAGKRRFYHSGDSLSYEGLVAWLGEDPFDVMFLPINGREPARGVPGNMSAMEAVELAARVKPRFVVPHHYDMFTFNTVPVATFEAAAVQLPESTRAVVLRCGERWEI